MSLLSDLREQRKSLIDELGAAVDKRTADRATFEALTEPTDELRSAEVGAETAFGADFDARQVAIKTLDRRIDEAELLERRTAEAAGASRNDVQVTAEPMTYRSDNAAKISYFRDLACAQVPAIASRLDDPTAANERLQRHAKEMSVELPKREAARERRAQAQADSAEREFRGSVGGLDRRGLNESPFERRVNPSRLDGQGGYFVPPLWLVDEYIPALRAGRVAANLCRQMTLPDGTDSINLPKIATGTTTAVQQDLGAVSSTDLTDTFVNAGVKTIAGQQDVALQLIEQSPGQIFDMAVMQDLMADYNQRLDLQVVRGTGASGQVQGIYPASWTGTQSLTWTSASPVGNGFNMLAAAMASKVSYNRFDLTNFNYLLHGRRWFWFASALDGGTTGRPLVNPDVTGYNVSATNADQVPAQGRAGQFPFGPSVYIDPNVPTDAGGIQDVAIAAKWDDLWLFEGAPRFRVLPEVLSGTLEVRFQLYNYVAFLVRYGQSIAIATGTGFAPPASALDASVLF
jgi:hypothetical protein